MPGPTRPSMGYQSLKKWNWMLSSHKESKQIRLYVRGARPRLELLIGERWCFQPPGVLHQNNSACPSKSNPDNLPLVSREPHTPSCAENADLLSTSQHSSPCLGSEFAAAFAEDTVDPATGRAAHATETQPAISSRLISSPHDACLARV